MTGAQRRKRNRENGSKSRGPITQSGKESACKNSLTHGLTAKILTLPGEDREILHARAQRWHDDYQPDGADEESLVNQLILGELRLDRIANAEHEILAEEGRIAETQWDLQRKRRLLKLRRKLDDDPAETLLHLRAFGLGVTWLLAKWKRLETAFQKGQGWNDLYKIREAIRLRSGDEAQIDEAVGSNRDFALFAVLCVDDFQTRPELVRFLQGYDYPDDWLAKIDGHVYSPTEARRTIRMCIEREIAGLRELERHFREVDAQSRAGAKARAQAPADTPKNGLMLRYRTSTELAFNRALKTLDKLQNDRAKAAEIEAKREASEAQKAGLRNEPSVVARSHSKEVYPGSYVTLLEQDYVVEEKGDGHITLKEIERRLETKPLEVASGSENAA